MKKHEMSQLHPSIETRNLNEIKAKTGNLYEAISIVSKRSRQIGTNIKEELVVKLEEFSSTSDNLEEIFENREQIEISKYYERLPKSTLVALAEFLGDKVYYRYPEVEIDEETSTEENS